MSSASAFPNSKLESVTEIRTNGTKPSDSRPRDHEHISSPKSVEATSRKGEKTATATKTVLIVDDSPVTRQILGFTLHEAGYQVSEAIDGKQAVQCLDDDVYSLIVTDLNMPRMDGIAFIERARRHPQNRFTPILMLTAARQEDRRRRGQAVGATGWLIKPFDPDKLLEVVRKLVR
jgi:two-component system chemotaxis response regulator CheY